MRVDHGRHNFQGASAMGGQQKSAFIQRQIIARTPLDLLVIGLYKEAIK
jgi:hypothetical protein